MVLMLIQKGGAKNTYKFLGGDHAGVLMLIQKGGAKNGVKYVDDAPVGS